MWVRVLGPIALYDADGAACQIPRGRSSALLAALLVNAGTAVSTDALVSYVWGDAPPAKTRIALQTMVARLRQSVGPEAAARLRTAPPGYLFHVDAGELDLHRFEQLSSEGSQAAAGSDWAKASASLAEALALWKGNPLADVSSEALQLDFVQPMIERRLDTVRRHNEAELELGHHNDLIPELTRLVEAHPLRESFRAQLMLALHRANRTADALAAYHDTRRLLARELGIDPGKELTGLHERIISGDETLHWSRPQGRTTDLEVGSGNEIDLVRELPMLERFPAQLMLVLHQSGRRSEALTVFAGLSGAKDFDPSPGLQRIHRLVLDSPSEPVRPTAAAPEEPEPVHQLPQPVPAQIPAGVVDFTGRTDHVAELQRRLIPRSSDGSGNGAVVISAIAGMGGVGKTTLAVHVSHSLDRHFPDGMLYSNLGGKSPQPRRPEEVVARFLIDLGFPRQQIPADLEASAALYRSALAARGVLVLLDDAHDAEQVRALISGKGASRVLITSRSRLAGLAEADRLDLDVLTEDEARVLFVEIVGQERTAAEPEALTEIVRFCGGLPLALRIVGARLASRPAWKLADLLERLRDAERAMDELEIEDLVLRASFQTSYDALPDTDDSLSPALAFRLLGVVDGPDISLPAAAALYGTSVAEVESVLGSLVDVNLLESPSAGRYRFHDLVRIYSRELAESTDSGQSLTEAVSRLAYWYLSSAYAARRAIPYPYREIQFEPVETALAFEHSSAAGDWLEHELENLLAMVRQASRLDLHDVAWKLAGTAFNYYMIRMYGSGWTETLRVGVNSAGLAGDERGVGWLLNGMAVCLGSVGDLDGAITYLEKSLEMAIATGDERRTLPPMTNLGVAYNRLQRYTAAREVLTRSVSVALAAHENAGSAAVAARYEYGAAKAYAALCIAENGLGNLDEALLAGEAALGFNRRAGDLTSEGDTCLVLGDVHRSRGRDEEALLYYERSLALYRSMRVPKGEVECLYRLAEMYGQLGLIEKADEVRAEADAIHDSLGGSRLESGLPEYSVPARRQRS